MSVFYIVFKENNSQVRGAPAIAIVGCLSVAVKLQSDESFCEMTADGLISQIKSWAAELVEARPTAVNMHTSASELSKICEVQKNSSTKDIIEKLVVNNVSLDFFVFMSRSVKYSLDFKNCNKFKQKLITFLISFTIS